MASITMKNPPKRSRAAKPLVILLQGPVGPFFSELRQQLIARGFDVIKVNFNGGDRFFSGSSDDINFVGSPPEWAAWLTDFMRLRRPAAITLFGDSRPYHLEALRVASDQRVAVWSLEEGYIRPNYIACERGGNNALSPIRWSARNPEFHPVARNLSGGNHIPAMAMFAALHTLAKSVSANRFRGNVSHKSRSLPSECVRWALNVARKVAYAESNRRVMSRIRDGQLCRYFIVALQVHDDLNLLRHGRGWTMERLIEETARSFSQHAPAGHLLLFKVHPLDRGHLPYRKLVTNAAMAYGCRGRFTVVDDGPIGQMIRHSDGVITVNSTSGLLALQQGKPLLVLGDAVYSSAALNTISPTSPDQLHAFWKTARSARRCDVYHFTDRLLCESLIEGSFYAQPFRSAACAGVADRIQNGVRSEHILALPDLLDEPHHGIVEFEHEQLAG